MSLASMKSRLVLTFLVPARPGGPGQTAVKRVCVCVNVGVTGIGTIFMGQMPFLSPVQ